MEFLKESFTVLSLADFYQARMRGLNFEENSAVITFDDGYEDNYTYAYPILQDLGLPFTVYLTTGFIEQEFKTLASYTQLKPLSWSQVNEMHQSGVGIGAHSHTHSILSQLPDELAEQEILLSKKIIEEHLGQSVTTFAYPRGQRNCFNSAIKRILKKHNFCLSCSTLWGGDNSSTDLYELRRVRIDPGDSMEEFTLKVQGCYDFVRFFQLARFI